MDPKMVQNRAPKASQAISQALLARSWPRRRILERFRLCFGLKNHAGMQFKSCALHACSGYVFRAFPSAPKRSGARGVCVLAVVVVSSVRCYLLLSGCFLKLLWLAFGMSCRRAFKKSKSDRKSYQNRSQIGPGGL